MLRIRMAHSSLKFSDIFQRLNGYKLYDSVFVVISHVITCQINW